MNRASHKTKTTTASPALTKGASKPTRQTPTPTAFTLQQPHAAHPRAIVALQRSYGNRAVQRLLAAPPAASPNGGELAPAAGAAIRQQLGGGQTVARAVGQRFAPTLGGAVEQARIHTDARADTLTRSLNAEAFTLGRDIFFSHGNYQPETADGQELLAHELTHVAQQSQQTVTAEQPLHVGPVHDAAEQEAEHVAERVTAPAGAPQVQRQMAITARPSAPRLQRTTRANRRNRQKKKQQQPQSSQPQPASIFTRIWNGFKSLTAALANNVKVSGGGDLATKLFGQLPFKYELAADSFSGELGPLAAFPLVPGVANLGLGVSAKGQLQEPEDPNATPKDKLKDMGKEALKEKAIEQGDKSLLTRLGNWWRGGEAQEEEGEETGNKHEQEFSPIGFGKDLLSGEGFKANQGNQQVTLEGSGSVELDLTFGKVTAALAQFKEGLAWAQEKLQTLISGEGWLSWALSWVDWAASYVPDWVPGKSAVSSAALLKWVADMAKGVDEFAKELKPKAALTLSGEGEYHGGGQMENIKTAVAFDIAAFGDSIREKLTGVAKFFGYEKVATGIEHLAGKVTLAEFVIPSVSRAQGLQGLKPKDFQAGPAFNMLATVIKAPFGYIKKLLGWG